MQKKRSPRCVLSALVVIALLSVTALAQSSVRAEGEAEYTATVSHVNPEYERLGVQIPASTSDDRTHAETTLGSVEEAAAYLREQMEQRVDTVTIQVEGYNFVDGPTIEADYIAILYGAWVHTGVPTQGDYIVRHYASSTGNIAYRAGMATFSYTITYDTTLEQENTVGTKIDELFAEWNEVYDFDGLTDYEQVKIIYDYICKNVVYDYDNLNDSAYTLKYTAYAALIEGTAVCQGYANLFYRMALEAGVDNRIIVGYGGGYHAWNIVELEEMYYYLDSTWDAPRAAAGSEYEYFLLGSAQFCVDHTPWATQEYDCNVADYPVDTANYVFIPPETKVVASGLCGAEEDGANLTWTLTADGTLTIGGEGAMAVYATAADTPWYPYLGEMKNLVLADGVTRISACAFAGSGVLAERVTGTCLARVSGAADAVYGEDGSVYCAAYAELTVYGLPFALSVAGGDFTQGEYWLVCCSETGSIDAYAQPVMILGRQTQLWPDENRHTIDGATYPDSANYILDAAGADQQQRYIWFLDNEGCVIGSCEIVYEVPGDVDGDGALTPRDAIELMRAVAGRKLEQFAPGQAAVADVNGDGTVSVRDAIIMLFLLASYSTR